MKSIIGQTKKSIMNHVIHDGCFYDFCLARYHNNRAKEITAIIVSFLKGKNVMQSPIFADYADCQSYNLNELEEILMEFDVISFDVFDTLLFRKVDIPTDVFQLVESTTACHGYAEKRQAAEATARRLKYQKTGSWEVNLQEIYQTSPLNNMPNVHKLMLAELRTEHNVSYANENLKLLAGRLHAIGKQIIAVSDMYLPQKEICKLLCENGYQGIAHIYVSCEYNASKSAGELFEIIKKEIGREKTICHIGDNFYSDVMSQKGKIEKTIHYIKGGIA